MAYDKAIAVITIACEASNQPHAARQGVAASIFNRLADGRFGATIAAICLKRFQYSEWNGDAADNANLERVARLGDDEPVIRDCAVAYDEAAAGADPTHGATHYHDTSIAPPAWTQHATRTCEIGALIFYRDVP
jgi:spore germination cell wall hydrolase CwlJ-like protein